LIDLSTVFTPSELAAPASPESIAAAEAALGGPLPTQLRELYRQTNGVQGLKNATLFDVQSLFERNETYGTIECLPRHLYVGNDNGNLGLFISKSDDDLKVYESDLGDQFEDGLVVLAPSLGEWFAQGCPWSDGDLGAPPAADSSADACGMIPFSALRPRQLFDFVAEFNWDDDLAPIDEILALPSCPLECAVLAFWRGEGPLYWVGDADPTTQLGPKMMALGGAVLAGRYLRAGIRYDPVAAEQLTKVHVYKLKKAGLPDVFFGPFAAR
jgi:hypothetical protein